MTSITSDPELEIRVKKASEQISENMHIVANEPSLAFYRLQEHVRKSLPPMVDKRVEVLQLHRELQGRCYDVEYAVGAVKSMRKAEENFRNIQALLEDARTLKLQLKYEEQRSFPSKSLEVDQKQHQRNSRLLSNQLAALGKKESTSSSVYKRLSAHIPLDLPDLPELSDALRETANRVESMMAQARHSSGSSSNSQPTNTNVPAATNSTPETSQGTK